MNTHLAFDQVNWISVFVASLSAFALGGLWYSPVLFSKRWVKELNITDTDTRNSNMMLIFGTTFILEFIAALVLEIILGPEATTSQGIITGAIIGLVWVATSIGVNYLFSQRSLALYLIDAGYFVFSL